MLKDLLKILALTPSISECALTKFIYFYAIQEHCHVQALLPSHSDVFLPMVTMWVSSEGYEGGVGFFTQTPLLNYA